MNSRILTADYADSADVLRKETSSIRLIREIRGQPLFQEFLTADYADSADVLRKEFYLPSVLSASSAVKTLPITPIPL